MKKRCTDKDFMNMVENDIIRKAEYYENGNLNQIAILFKDTNNIYLYDNLNYLKSAKEIDSEKDILANRNYTKKYNLYDFMTVAPICTDKDVPKRVTYSLLQSKTITSGGKTYSRELYGGTDMREYLTKSWHHNAGTQVSIVLTILGVFFPEIALIAAIVGISGGCILDSLTTQYYQRDYFWKYKVVQTAPTSSTLYSREYYYLKEAEIRYNSTCNGWKIIYTDSNVSSYSFRDNMLENPYYLFFHEQS